MGKDEFGKNSIIIPYIVAVIGAVLGVTANFINYVILRGLFFSSKTSVIKLIIDVLNDPESELTNANEKIIFAILIASIIFSMLALLFALIKKMIPTIVFAILAVVAMLMNGSAWIHYAACFITIVGAIWYMIAKHRYSSADQGYDDEELSYTMVPSERKVRNRQPAKSRKNVVTGILILLELLLVATAVIFLFRSNRNNNNSTNTKAVSQTESKILNADESDTTGSEEYVVEENNSGESETSEAGSQLRSILNTIKGKEQKTVENLRVKLDTVYKEVGETYEGVTTNVSLIEGWYELEKTESNNLYEQIKLATAEYYREMAATIDRGSDAWSEACDVFEDEICDGLFDDYRSKIDDGFYKDINSKYYDGIIGSAEDTVDYSSWLDFSSDFYSNWLDADSDFYGDWLDIDSNIYGTLLDISSAQYKETFDVESFISEHNLTGTGSFTVDPDAKDITFENEISAESDENNEPVEVNFDSATKWYRENPMLIGEGIYFVGTDIAPGSYGIKCDSAEYGMAVIVFETEDAYYAYHHSGRFTVGEENDAIEENSSQSQYIYEGDTVALNLREGNVLRIKSGIGELVPSDPNTTNETTTQIGNTINLFDGNYVVGKDINAGGYMVTATGDYGTQFVVFESEQKVADFDAADHFTNGEFGADVEQNAMMSIYVNKGKQCYINLHDGMVLMVHNGDGIAQEVKMAWAK